MTKFTEELVDQIETFIHNTFLHHNTSLEIVKKDVIRAYDLRWITLNEYERITKKLNSITDILEKRIEKLKGVE